MVVSLTLRFMLYAFIRPCETAFSALNNTMTQLRSRLIVQCELRVSLSIFGDMIFLTISTQQIFLTECRYPGQLLDVIFIRYF